jgi:soluble lytic murein transglycosylase-like protein
VDTFTNIRTQAARAAHLAGGAARRAACRAATAGRNCLAALGLAVIALAAAEAFRAVPEAESAVSVSPPAAASAARAAARTAARRDDTRRRALADYLARRFRVASQVTAQIVDFAYETGRQVGLDPLIILSVIAVESGFNPVAESGMGAKGLMQVIPKHHAVLLREHGGEKAMLDPPTNILLGARILKSYVSQTGSLEAGLLFYNGSLADVSGEYAQKVFAEKARLEERLQPGFGAGGPAPGST